MFWSRGEGEVAVGVAVGQVAAQVDLGRARVAERQVDRHRRQPGRALRADAGAPAPGRDVAQDLDTVGRAQHLDCGHRRVRPCARDLEGLLPHGTEAVGPEVGHDELHPALGGLVEAAMGHEHVDQRLDGGEHLGAGDERREQHGQRRRLAEAAARPHLVARHADLDRRDQAHVVDEGVVAAAGRPAEGDVDPARQHHVELGRAGHERVRDQAGVGEAVERLVQPDAGVLGGHHVADRVPARRPGRQPVPAERLEHLGHFAVADPVQLDLLAGGEVHPVLGVAGRHPGEAPHLRGRGHAAGDADADHEHLVLQLGAHAVGLQGEAVLGGEPAVALGGQPGQVDGEAGALGRGDVRSCHATDCGERDPVPWFPRGERSLTAGRGPP